MCGIAGFFDVDSASADPRRLLTRMLSALHHRGPDERGLWFDERAGLATARLSIIDLAHGQQPMSAENGRYWIAFNGEIFNYLELRRDLERAGRRFATESDTEVLLQALLEWGDEAVGRLNGQFAFLFYDRRRRRLLLARDRFGERPLFFARLGHGLVAASEIKAIFALPEVRRAIDPVVLQRLFRLWVPLPDETCFAGVEQLAPGHLAVFADGRLDDRPYYRLPLGRIRRASLPEAVERVRSSLEQSVRLRLRSEVEVGTYSSGGLDSTITTGLAQRLHEQPVRTFAIGFDDPSFDETRYQEEVAARFGTRHYTVRIARRDIARVFPEVVWHAETALFRTAPAPMYLLAEQVRAAGIKVVLTGEGADEAFLGYDIFKETLIRSRFHDLDGEARLAAIERLYPYLPHFNRENAAALARIFAQHAEEHTRHLFSHEMRFGSAAFAGRLLAPTGEADDDAARLSAWLTAEAPDLDRCSPIEKAQLLEYTTLLHGYLLSSQGDRMAAAWGVEGRCPFLDPEVVELALSLPEDLRLSEGLREKHVLKEAFGGELPASVVERAKQPYRAPDAVALREAMDGEWLEPLLRPAAIEASGLFDAKKASLFVERLRTLPEAAIGPREDHAMVLLVSTLLLQQRFVDALPAEPYERQLGEVRVIDGREGVSA